MGRRMFTVVCIGAMGAGLAAGRQCAVCDDFDSHSLGGLCAQSGWEEWGDRLGMDACGVVTDEQAFNGSQSLKIVGDPGGQFDLGDRFVHRVDLFGGRFLYTMMLFVPSGASGVAYISTWSDQNLTQESMRIRVDADNDMVVSELGGLAQPLIRDRWVLLRGGGDLGQREVDAYYDGEYLGNNFSVTHRIEAISFYGGEPGAGITAMYVDDLQLPGSGCAPCDANCDGEINAFDIEPFLDILFGPGIPCSPCAGNANYDHDLNAFDIEPFLDCLFP